MCQTASVADWPLVGRAAELERLEALLADRVGGAVLAGPPGVGKTRLGVTSLTVAAASFFSGSLGFLGCQTG
jgi:ATP-dependent Clp protease ATP-binding subunit ClpA